MNNKFLKAMVFEMIDSKVEFRNCVFYITNFINFHANKNLEFESVEFATQMS